MLRAFSLASLCVVFGYGVFGHSAEPAADKPPLNKQFAEQLLKIAKEYESYGRVDDETRWAPLLCRSPHPSRVRVSESDDEETHGRKLYFIFAKNHAEYLGRDLKGIVPAEAAKINAPHPVGQVIVKESWTPEKVVADTPQKEVYLPPKPGPKEGVEAAVPGAYLPFAKQGHDLFHAKEKAGLFIMFKLADETPDTDLGWVYGTVSADGKTATAAGKVQSCIECHEKAPRDRLFGMKYGGL